MTEYLDLEALLILTRRLGAGPVRDPGLLESACARPQATVFGEDAYPSLAEKAAALLHSITRNHALVDGNKRLGWFATVSFLAINDLLVDLDDDVAFEFVIAVARGDLEVGQMAAELERALIPRRG